MIRRILSTRLFSSGGSIRSARPVAHIPLTEQERIQRLEQQVEKVEEMLAGVVGASAGLFLGIFLFK
jgi:hypothetical protein